ncbi:MAG TPA: COX15/CtaA family protein [Candidatus Methylacidiphilales bacterium]|jgi:cytochrome c oxidase assembly protein subunit 15|nr:COX15/CtaA family protein [Candidatus Methylacidiphilales bacterium]
MHAPSPDHRLPPETGRPRYRWALHRFACFCAGSILFLICLGGLVTSHNAGMSVPDWPNSYGYNMFLFPWDKWVGGIFYEHSHRLVASGVGVLMTILAVWLCFQERVWLRWMGAVVPVFVLLEGTIGGLRVVLSEDQLGILHGALAQLLFVSVSLIALFTSRWWIEAGPAVTPRNWTGRALAICGLIFCQLLLGATMRHEHNGLSIPDFPLAYGQLWPKTDPASVDAYNLERLRQSTFDHPIYGTSALYINIQMAHRVGAVLITVAILAAAAAVWLAPGSAPILRRWSAVWVFLVFLQFALGAFTIWTNKAADVATTHVAVGALTLVLGALLAAMSWRLQSRAELAKRDLA